MPIQNGPYWRQWLPVLLVSWTLTVLPAVAHAQESIFIVHLTSGSETAEAGPVSTVMDAPVTLALVWQKTEQGKAHYFGPVKNLRLGHRLIPVKPPPDGLRRIRWYKIEPFMIHAAGEGHDPANPGFLWYANAGAPGGRTDRQPLPPDIIRYQSIELDHFRDAWQIRADAHPSEAYDIHEGLGTMYFAAELEEKDRPPIQSPSLSRYRPGDPLPSRLARVVIRRDNSYVGYLTGYFNVPGVFGSYDDEVIHHLGADCADLVVGAWREYSGKPVAFSNVTGLRYEFPSKGRMKLVQADVWLSSDGKIYKRYDPANGALTEEAEIPARAGDVLVFNYSTDPRRRSWDHTGVVYRDDREVRRLTGEDLVLHAGPAEAHIDPLGSDKFVEPSQPTRMAVLRWQ